MLIVAKIRSTYHTVNRKRLSQRLRRVCRKPRKRTRSRRRSIRLGCSNFLFNAYLSLGNHAFSGDILHSLPCRSPLGCGVVGCHRSRANSSPKARARQPITLGSETRDARACSPFQLRSAWTTTSQSSKDPGTLTGGYRSIFSNLHYAIVEAIGETLEVRLQMGKPATSHHTRV